MILLFLAVGLLLASALLKLRAASRADLGLHLPSLLELLMALALAAVAGSGPDAARRALGLLVVAVLVLVASSVHLVMRLRRRSRLREHTEGRRLEAFVRYLSEPENGLPEGLRRRDP